MWPAGTRLDLDVADPHAFAILQRLLAGVGHVLEAGAHDRQRLGRGQRRAMAGPGMVAMAVGDHGARSPPRPDRRRSRPARSRGRAASDRARSEDRGCRSLKLMHPTRRDMGLPDLFARWFESRGWTPRPHQLALIDLARQGKSALLIAPTGGGKTLAGFLPSLIELTERRLAGKDLAHAKGKGELHTLYISPLKALATDIRRNLEMPIAEMQLPVRAESRTGDTPQSRRLRQRERPPDLLMTTPESLALLLSLSRRRAVLRQPALRDHRRAAFLRHHQARPSPGALPGARWRRCRRRRASSACRPRSPIRRSWPTSCACATDEVEIVQGEPGAQPVVTHHRRPGAPAVGRPHGPSRGARGLQHHPPAQDLDRVRQHARPGRAGVRPAVAHQRGEPGDRPASRLAGRRAAPQGRGGDGGRQAARRGGDLLARPRHRLGRRRSRDPDGRAQGREPPDAAHRPRQPSARRAEPRHDRAGQPLRGAGIAGRAGSRRGARARRRSAAAALPRRAGPAHRRLAPAPSRSTATSLLRGGADARSPTASCRARISTTPSTSSPPAAMRWRPTSAGIG